MRSLQTAVILILLLGAVPALAQRDRLQRPIDNARRAALRGYRHPEATRARDQGRLDGARRISGITLMLKPSAEQQADLDRYLRELQDPSSSNYHNWLTPEEYADRFGLSVNDFARIVSWVAEQGFQVDYQARGRNSVAFSGSAAEVQRAFRTELHRYAVNGEEHFANSGDPSIPADLEPFVVVIQGLDDFRLKARPFKKGKPIAELNGELNAEFTNGNGDHFVSPGDLATIYNLGPLYQRGIDGSGQKIVVVGQSGFRMSDLQAFRTRFGLPRNDPQLVLVPGFPDPGIVNGDDGEATLDVEWAGGMAPNATLLFVYSTHVSSAVQYAIDQNLAPILSSSYGYCEPKISSNPAGTASAYRALAQQAASQGITFIAASGDSGAADCEPNDGSAKAGINGPTVDLPASVPEVTGVGGSEFNEGSGRYWNTATAANGSSALSYIPEVAWNDTARGLGLASGGGGASVFFSKPAWQTGPGVPSDNARDVPDVSLNASGAHDGYLVYLKGQLTSIGGTSAAAPTFAAMIALLNQSLANDGVKGGQGNINPNLYRLAQTNPDVFHDITGGDNIVPCSAGTTGCTSGSYGFRAGPGYDQATGLGSLDADALVRKWSGASTPSLISTSLSAVANPAAVSIGGSTTLTATVRGLTGSAPPAGSVSFNLDRTALGSVDLSGAGGAAATASLTVSGSQLPAGSSSIRVVYGGNATFAASSGSLTVSVSVPTTSSAVVPSVVPTPVNQQAPDADGYAWFYTLRLTEIGGTPTTLTGFTIAGTDYSSDIAGFFGSTALPARGTLSAAVRSRGLTVPADRLFTFTGIDASGSTWRQQVSVPFLPTQISASMKLSSSPSIEIQNPNGDPACSSSYPFLQQLNLEERNGVGVTLTKFLADSNDFSDSIQDWFGTYRLAPLGALRARICWKIPSVPTTLSYEVDGIDTGGNKISTTATVPFQGPGSSPGVLSASRGAVSLSAATAQSATGSLAVNVPNNENWSVSVFPANQKSSWLVVFPQSGTGPATVNLSASASGLTNGVYSATLVFQSTNTIPQFFNTQVTFTIGQSSAVSVAGVSNGASFVAAAAPGMLVSVFGTRLANSTRAVSSLPLPTVLDGVSVTVNGLPAPFYYISPSQLNVQIPYETPAGAAILAVSNSGLVTSFQFSVKAAAPGIFTAGNGSLVPFSSLARGQAAVLFMTGEGDTLPALGTGAPPSNSAAVNQLPSPRQPVTMTVGGVSVTPFFVGIPYGLVGVTQVNFIVPANAPPGVQPVIVTVGGTASKAGSLNITPATSSSLESADITALLPHTSAVPADGAVQDAPQLPTMQGK